MKNTNFLITFASVLSLAVISSGAFNQPVSAGAARKAAAAGIIANTMANQNIPPVVYQNTVPTTSVSASTAVTPNQNNQSAVYQNTVPTTPVSAPTISAPGVVPSSAPGSAPSSAPVTKQSVDAGSHSLEEKDIEEIVKKAYSEWSSKEKNSAKKGGKLPEKQSKKQSKSKSTEKDGRQKKGGKPAVYGQKIGEKAPAA